MVASPCLEDIFNDNDRDEDDNDTPMNIQSRDNEWEVSSENMLIGEKNIQVTNKCNNQLNLQQKRDANTINVPRTSK